MPLLPSGRAGEPVCSQMEGLLSLQELPVSNGRTRSDFVFSILGSEAAAAGPEQSAAAAPVGGVGCICPSLQAHLVSLLWISLGYLQTVDAVGERGSLWLWKRPGPRAELIGPQGDGPGDLYLISAAFGPLSSGQVLNFP